MRKMELLLATAITFGSAALAGAQELPAMKVWKTPWCGCCGAWVQHMQAAGFKVTVRDTETLGAIKQRLGIPENLQSCHTATIAGYRIEGHVPAGDVKRLLTSRLKVTGLSVPGMVSGSPGMENGRRDPYDVIAFAPDGRTTVFSSYK